MVSNWIAGTDYPAWMTEESLQTLYKQHLQNNETPEMMFQRIVDAYEEILVEYNTRITNIDKKLDIPYIKKKWFDYLWYGWLSASTPIMASVGTERGLGISCYILRVDDTLDSIYSKVHELAMLTKGGGGVGITIDKIRGHGEPITNNGFSSGVIPYCKVYDSAILAANQAAIRRGAASLNLPVRHKDIKEFLEIRKPKGDVNRQCLNVNHCVTIDDYFMNMLMEGDSDARDVWGKLIASRIETGQPYIMYYHNAHNQRPQDMIKRGLKIDGTNICCLSADTEVMTQEGIFQIKDLVGKEVTIYDGENWVKCNNFKEYDEDNLIRIHFKNGTHVDSNKDHRWFAARNYNDIRRDIYRETKTKDLSEGMFLEDSMNTLECYGRDSLDAAYLKGFLLGDGTHIKDRPLLNVHFPKYVCTTALIDSALELKNPVNNTNSLKTISFTNEVVHNDTWGKQCFRQMQGITQFKEELLPFTTIYKSELPDFRNLNQKDKLLLISGILDADGTYSTAGIQVSSIHESFIKELQKLLFSIGVTSSVDFSGKTYRLTIGTYDSYYNLFDKLSCMRLEKPETAPSRRTTGYRQIVNIENLNVKEKVYCPQVPTTKKFLLANGIMTGNTEIFLPHTAKETVVCCLASLNMAMYDQWKDDLEFIELSLLFLDCNTELFIKKAATKPGLDKAVSFAKKSRALGLGILGFHTYLQQKNVSFSSIVTTGIINTVGRKMKEEGAYYNKKYGELLGNPEWCDENRNLTLFAIAPTTTTSLVQAGVSQGIEPIVSNVFVQKSAKGTFIRVNNQFKNLIENKYPEYNTSDFYYTLGVDHGGSVQHLPFLTEEEKQVFLTAYEINQLSVINNASHWQKYIDQGISLNLFFAKGAPAKFINTCHLQAWTKGLKSLYYVRSESAAGLSMIDKTSTDTPTTLTSTYDEACEFCQG